MQDILELLRDLRRLLVTRLLVRPVRSPELRRVRVESEQHLSVP